LLSFQFKSLRAEDVAEGIVGTDTSTTDAAVSYNGAQISSAIDIFAKVKEGILTIEQAIVLVNNGTETAWGNQLLSTCSAVCFPKTRIRFISPSGVQGDSPLQGQMICYIGNKVEKFVNELTSIDSKLVNLYMHLKSKDIYSLDFSTLKKIDGVLYRLNLIKDFDSDAFESTEVELLKYLR